MCEPDLMAIQTFSLLINQLAQLGVIHKVCTLVGGRGWGLAGQKVYWLKWGRGGTFDCKFMYAMNFFLSLRINRNKVKVGYSHIQIIYLFHTVTKHKLNPRALHDVVQIQYFLIALCSGFFTLLYFFCKFPTGNLKYVRKLIF